MKPQSIRRYPWLTVANGITFIGMLLAVAGIICLFDDLVWVSFWLILVAGLSDVLDGWAARWIERRHIGYGVSEFGAKLDPVRDKLVALIIFPLALQSGIGWCWPLAVAFMDTIPIYLLGRKLIRLTGQVFISKVSKMLTLVEGLFILLWFWQLLDPVPDSVLPAQSIVTILLAVAVIRNLVYWIEARSLSLLQK